MILTGLAKEDFLSWYGTGEHYFTTTLKPIEQYANIIGWLDSVDIHTEIEPNLGGGAVVYYSKVHYRNEEFIDKWDDVQNLNYSPIIYYFNTRQQATEAAIKLANQIYNNKL